mgnify:CR=1 FL=1
MKFQTKMCHSHLMSMLLMPEKFQGAVVSYHATAPDVDNEEFNGYMEVDATFIIKDLTKFGELWQEGYVYPSDRAKWYNGIRRGLDKFNEE